MLEIQTGGIDPATELGRKFQETMEQMRLLYAEAAQEHAKAAAEARDRQGAVAVEVDDDCLELEMDETFAFKREFSSLLHAGGVAVPEEHQGVLPTTSHTFHFPTGVLRKIFA